MLAQGFWFLAGLISTNRENATNYRASLDVIGVVVGLAIHFAFFLHEDTGFIAGLILTDRNTFVTN